MQRHIRDGIYPTMIAPYASDGRLDEEALRKLVRWYGRKGCQGIFAACQSSEVFYLSMEERKKMVEVVKDEASRQEEGASMTIVASGHVSESIEAQAEELMTIHEAGADAVILISNRMDIPNTGTGAWVRDLEKLLYRLPSDIKLGVYECPTPYKRLLDDEMLQTIRDTGRFYFFKDTCCDPGLLEKRAVLLKGSTLKLFNANAQTFLASLQHGYSGYCGIMANFHPELYVWLHQHYQLLAEEADLLEDILSMAAFTEALPYPVTAKHYLSQYEGIPMTAISRSCGRELETYDKLILEQLYRLSRHYSQRLAERT